MLFILAAVIVLLLGVTVSTGNFFFSTDYYKTPLEAYNESMITNPAISQIGYLDIGGNAGLFIGEIDKDTFVIADMDVKGGRYSHKSLTSFYQSDYKFNPAYYEKIKTQSGTVKYTAAYNKDDLKKLKCDYMVKQYKTPSGQEIYIAVF